MAPPYEHFEELLASQPEAEWTKLKEQQEYIRVGDHVYIYSDKIDITSTLDELCRYGTENGKDPIQYIHIYCHQLTGTITENGELWLRLSTEGYSLTSLHIFAVQFPPITGLVLDTNGAPSQVFELRLFFDVESGPRQFWIRRSASGDDRIHFLQGPQIATECDEKICSSLPHLELSKTTAAGAQVLFTGQDNGMTSEPVQSVSWEELRPVRLAELEFFGPHRLRLQILPRLLNDLFSSAGSELMGQAPQINRIISKLRFVKRCARSAPQLSRLVAETDTLLKRLELPRTFHLDIAEDKKMDWFYVPQYSPKALTTSMQAEMTLLLDTNKDLEQEERTQKILNLVSTSADEMMKAVIPVVGREIDKTRVESAKTDAQGTTLTVSLKMDELRKVSDKMEEAATRFKTGMEAYKGRLAASLWKEVGKGLAQIAFSVGVAVYTGGAGAPLTVGVFNQFLKNVKEIEEQSKIVVAMKKVFETALGIYPKIEAALRNHSSYSGTSEKTVVRENDISRHLSEVASDITSKMYSRKSNETTDFAALLVEWRELDFHTNKAFEAIKEEVKSDKIEGLDEFHSAMKLLTIRGEILVGLLRDAQDARKKYLQMLAEKIAKDNAVAEIKEMADRVESNGLSTRIGFILLKERLLAEIGQRRRVIFNRLHEVILALTYATNNVKLQKDKFSELSPGMNAKQLADVWAEVYRYTWAPTEDESQPVSQQDRQIVVTAAEACPSTWRELLATDLRIPFHIPPTASGVVEGHRLRMKGIYVTFVGLKPKTEGAVVTYNITMGPLMLDRARPSPKAPEEAATVVQYYAAPRLLIKDGDKNNLQNSDGQLADVALLCLGTISFKKSNIEGWDLGTVTDLRITADYIMRTFD